MQDRRRTHIEKQPVCPSSMGIKTTLPVLYTHFTVRIHSAPSGTKRNRIKRVSKVNRQGRDKLNWSPCHHSLSLTASCHSNKLDCCRMRPINCDVRRPCQVPRARCNCEHQWFLGFAGALYQMPFSILHLSWFVNAFSDRLWKHFIFVFFVLNGNVLNLRANSTCTTQPLYKSAIQDVMIKAIRPEVRPSHK